MGQVTRTTFGLVKEIRLTNAEILTLFSVPVTLLPARQNVAWLPVALVIASNTAAAVYATAAHITLGITGTLTKWANITLANSGLASNNAGEISYQGIINTTPIVGNGLANEPIILSANADPTGGDPANFANVQLFYVATPTT